MPRSSGAIGFVMSVVSAEMTIRSNHRGSYWVPGW